MRLRDEALSIWQAGVNAVHPDVFMPELIRVEKDCLLVAGQKLPLDSSGSWTIVGAGKAGHTMLQAFEAAVGPDILKRKRVTGIINVLNSFADDYRPGVKLHGSRPEGDPLPTQAGVAGSLEMLTLVQGLGPDDTVIAFFSGGASALLPLPVTGVTLAEKRDATALLSKAGATIPELNAVRKHLSRVKGGRLAAASKAGRWISLILSDVIGNPLDVIASGPAVADPTTFGDALNVIRTYKLETRVPVSVMRHLERGHQGLEDETPKSLPPCITNHIVADSAKALQAAARAASEKGYAVTVEPNPIQGVARIEGAGLMERALALKAASSGKPVCLLAGGEPVVQRVVPGGKGGRNQEIALGAYSKIAATGFEGCLLAAGTDGEDGPTDAAGAYCDMDLCKAARIQRLDPAAYFIASRTYDFFARTNALLKTGPTGTNVMDLAVILV